MQVLTAKHEHIIPKKNYTRHENFHGKFSLCAEYLIRLIGQKLTCMLKVFSDYSEVFIWKKIQTKKYIALHIKLKSEKSRSVGQM